MNKIEFLKNLLIPDSNLDEVIHAHPRQILSTELPVPVWRIKYSYTTARNNQKTGIKYAILDESAWDMITNEFYAHIDRINEKYPERKISNVRILDVDFMGQASIELE